MYYVKLVNTKNEKEIVLEYNSKDEAMQDLASTVIPTYIEVIQWDESYEELYIKTLEEYVAYYGLQ